MDVPALFSRVGIEVGNTGERVGTFAIAYAAHKALSPVSRNSSSNSGLLTMALLLQNAVSR